MIIKFPKKFKAHIYALFFFLSPFSFAAPVFNIDDQYLLQDAQVKHEYYFNEYNAASYINSFADSSSYLAAEQFHKLLDARAISGAPEYKVDEIFLSAFKQLKISTSDHLDFLLTAFTSPVYKASPSLQLLMAVYQSVIYGSATQATIQSNINWEYDRNSILWFLGNHVVYHFLKRKPHYQVFLNNAYANKGFPALYNPPHSYFLWTLMLGGSEHSWKDVGSEFGHAFLWGLSCNFNGEELRNQMGFLENCKVDKHSGYTELKGLKQDESYLLESEATPGPSRMRLTPVPGYVKKFTDINASPEEYSYKSLQHIVSKVVTDKTEGALFYVLYRGLDKYQFFTIGVYQGFLSISFVVDHHAPTPVLSYQIPLRGMNLDQMVNGIDALLHQDRSPHNMVPDLQGVWMMSSQ